jgi:pimeloyl-ACP methyl ester carboxylesterase
MFVEKTVQCLHPDGSHPLVYSEFPGDPAKTVVCVHGLSRNGRDFDWLAEALAKDGYRVICPDMPGRGRSPAFDNPAFYNYSQYLADLMTLLAQVGVEKIDWIGTSMGGLLGMMIAAQPKHPIKRMIINDIGPFIPKEAAVEIKDYVGRNPSFDTWDAFMAAFKIRMAGFGLETEEEWNYLAKISAFYEPDGKIRINYDTNVIAGLTSGGPIEDVDLWPLWEKIDMPLLILRGANSKILSAQTLENMLVGKQAEAVTFPNVGHAPKLMSRHEIDLIRNWLNLT